MYLKLPGSNREGGRGAEDIDADGLCKGGIRWPIDRETATIIKLLGQLGEMVASRGELNVPFFLRGIAA